MVCEQLKRNTESHAFDGTHDLRLHLFSPLLSLPLLSLSLVAMTTSVMSKLSYSTLLGYKVHWEEESTAVTCLNTLTEASLNSEVCCHTNRPTCTNVC